MTKLRMLFAALLLPSVLAAQESLLTLDRGHAYEFTWDRQNSRWVARIYVTSKPELRKNPIKVSLQSVAFGSRTDPGLSNLFHVATVQAGPPLTSFDILSGGNAPVLPGTYQATLNFAAGKTSQTANVQMTVPAAVLSTPSSLQLTRVRLSPFPDLNPELEIWETSGLSPASVQARQTDPFAASENQYGGQILIDPASVSPDGHANLSYRLRGGFPLGTVAAKISISSHQLQAPLVIPVQVRTRLTGLILAGIIVVGLVLGFLMRMVLKPLIEIGEARQRAREADRSLQQLLRKPDAKFQEQIKTAISELEQAARADVATTATIANAIKAAEEAGQKALDDLKAEMQTAETEINELAQIVTPAWSLPAEMAKALTAPTQAIEKAKGLLKESDARQARDTIQSASKDFRAALQQLTQTWSDRATRLVTQLDSLKQLMEEERRERYSTAWKALCDTVASVLIDPRANVAGLNAALEGVHRFEKTLPEFVSKAAEDLWATFTAMDAVIGPIDLPEQGKGLWNEAKKSTKEFVAGLKKIAGESPGWENLEQQAQRLRAQWRDALVSEVKDAGAITTEFEACKYEAAALALGKALGVGPAGTSLGDREGAVRKIPGAATPESYAGPEDVRVPPSEGTPAAAPPIEPPDFAAFGRISERKLRQAKLLQWSISGMALTIVGYLIFADKFVGSSGDLLSAFFWGFTTDIGVDALITAAKPK